MPEFTSNKPFVPQWKKSVEAQRQDIELKKILNQNLKNEIKNKKPRPDLIENFHWIIMRFRRQRKLTQEQLAEAISESPVVIKKAELGIVPEGDYTLITKIEDFLKIKLRKEKAEAQPEKTEPTPTLKEISFEGKVPEDLKIEDLKRMHKEQLAKDLWEYTEYLRSKEKQKPKEEWY